MLTTDWQDCRSSGPMLTSAHSTRGDNVLVRMPVFHDTSRGMSTTSGGIVHSPAPPKVAP